MRTELKYGSIAGIGVSAYILLEFLLGFHTTRPDIGEYSGYFSSIIPIAVILFAIKEKRDRSFNGTITFGQAFITGIIVTAISAFIITAFFVIYNYYINPEMMSVLSAYKAEQMRLQNISEDEIAASIEEWNAMNNPLFVFAGSFFMGLIITIIFSMMIRKKTPPPAPTDI